VAPARIATFLERYKALPIAASLRDAWLHALIRRRDWREFGAFYVERNDPTLRCGALQARLMRGADPTFLADAQAAWLSAQSVPTLCDPSFMALKVAGRITPDLIWRRIDLAIDAGNTTLVRFLARSLPPADQARAAGYADFIAVPNAAKASAWPVDARSRRVVTQALLALAERSPDDAEALLAALTPRYTLDAGQRGTVLNRIALWSAASYLPSSAPRFARVPAAAFDDRLHEWRAREALARNDLAATRRAIAAMPAALRADPRWRYVDARLQEKLGQRTAARAVFADVANQATYFGFLAADRLGQPYALCPVEVDVAHRDAVARNPALQRALELRAIQRDSWALREWDAAIAAMSAGDKRIAVAIAEDDGWHDRGVFTLNSGDDLRLYTLRFPLAHAVHLRAEARKNDLDPSWAAALIRAESAWIARAHSHANARGLMQLLPSTARDEARRLGIRYEGDEALFQPIGNITLGTAHLAQMLRRHGGQTYLATAAYNAGAGAVARWLSQRTPTDPDLWIETIPYRETREYVARILAFSAIYDWRLQGKAVPITQRMLGADVRRVARREFLCPLTTPVAISP
jgi:soluble lytic murein transglycosylase